MPMTALPACPAPPQVKKTILVVDDEPILRMLIGLILRQKGYTVLEACDGKEAFDLFVDNRIPIHLLVTDLVMPRMGGGWNSPTGCRSCGRRQGSFSYPATHAK